MDEAEFWASELADCEARFRMGDYRHVVRALQICGQAQLPLPDWLAAEAVVATKFYFYNGGSQGKGKTGSVLTRHNRQMRDRQRHQIAAHELDRRRLIGGNRDDAFERASQRLAGTEAQGSAKAIERSYDQVQRTLKANPAHPR